jgi:hypothetical protein
VGCILHSPPRISHKYAKHASFSPTCAPQWQAFIRNDAANSGQPKRQSVVLHDIRSTFSAIA